ncbi:hypothetical protein AB1282_12175 [Gottfriedia sp. S16(2024)]|nr:hypothetical protein [Bacillus sp. FJAT-25509]
MNRNYSFMKPWVYAEAFTLLPSLDEPSTIKYVEAGAKVKVTDETGKE